MDAADPLAILREQVTRAREERDHARAQLDKLRTELEAARAARAADVLGRARAKRRNLILAMATASSVIIGGGVALYLWMTHVAPETLSGTVTAVDGPAPADVGETCTAKLTSELGPFNARLVVDCGTQRIYGSDTFGAIRCTASSGRAVTCSDPKPIGTDGDPAVALDRPANRLVVSDGPRWRIQIALPPKP